MVLSAVRLPRAGAGQGARRFSPSTALAGLLASLALLLVASYAAFGANADISLGCQYVWSGADANNDIVDCLADTKRIGKYWRFYVFPGFGALLFLLIFFVFPFIFLSCLCCTKCCRKNCYPSSPPAHYNARCCLWVWIIVGILWGAGCLVAIVMGANTAYVGVQDTLSLARHNVAGYFNASTQAIIDYGTSGSTTGLPPSIVEAFSSASRLSDEINSLLDTFDTKYFQYVRDIAIVSYCVAWIPFVMMLATACFALCNVHLCLPSLCSVMMWVVGFVFALLSIVMLVVAYASISVCEEIQLQDFRSPGVLQWYGVPYCQEQFGADLTALVGALATLEAGYSTLACTQLALACETPAQGTPGKLFYCPNPPSSCTTSAQVQDFIDSAPSQLQGDCLFNDPSLPSSFTACNVESCAYTCDYPTTATPGAKTTASRGVMALAGRARNATIARAIATALSDCDLYVDSALWAFNYLDSVKLNRDVYVVRSEKAVENNEATIGISNKGSTCHAIREGLWMAGTAYFIDALVCAIGIYATLRGRVVWGEYEAVSQRKHYSDDD